MKTTRINLAIALTFLAGLAFAGGPPAGSPSPFGEIQARLDELEAQVEALQAAAPDSSVEDRTYCMVLDLQLLRGFGFNATEEVQSNVIRRTAIFSGGTFTGSLLSNVMNVQHDDGIVSTGLGTPIDPVIATYVQTDRKIDVTFGDGSTANWYVSKDGSVIHGSTIRHGAFGPNGVVTIGFLRSWTFVENDTCDMEGQ